MQKLFIVFLFLSITIYGWEWNGIKEEMTYQETLQILGVPLNITSTSDKSLTILFEIVAAKYIYKGYEITITFIRHHSINQSIWTGSIGVDYESDKPFEVIALAIIPYEKKITKVDINGEFGKPKKVGMHIELGLREEFENGAIVDYEKDGITISRIKYGDSAHIH